MNHKIFEDDEVKNIILQSMDCSGGEFSEEELVTHLRKPPSETVVRVNMLITDQCHLKADLIPSLLTVLNMKAKALQVLLLSHILILMMYW